MMFLRSVGDLGLQDFVGYYRTMQSPVVVTKIPHAHQNIILKHKEAIIIQVGGGDGVGHDFDDGCDGKENDLELLED